ncbi:MAG: hypothetical protein K5669_00910 [Lachnospiraceae bacterium]|nr:hypothetical protein [Lachnospiraceae bacterium]
MTDQNILKTTKTAFGLLKYSMQLKTNIILMIVFIIMGLMYEVMSMFGGTGVAFYNGAWMFALAPMYIVQLLYSVFMAGVIQSSGIKKAVMTDGAFMLKEIVTLTGFLIIAVCRYFSFKNGHNNADSILFGLLFFGAFNILTSIYTIVIYRFMYAGYIIILPILLVFMLAPLFNDALNIFKGDLAGTVLSALHLSGNYAMCLLTAVGLLLIDALVFYFLSKGLYNYSLDERVFKRLLARVR